MTDGWVIVSAFSAGVSALAAIGSLCVARRAKQAAKKANVIAEGALAEARLANELAVKANDLARNANLISDQARRAAAENLTYEWLLEVDDSGTAFLTNDGAEEAHDVRAVVTAGEDVSEVEARADLVPAGGHLSLDISSAFKQHIAEARQEKPVIIAATSGGVVRGQPRAKTLRLEAKVRFATPAGKQLDDRVEHSVRHRARKDGTIERLRAGRS